MAAIQDRDFHLSRAPDQDVPNPVVFDAGEIRIRSVGVGQRQAQLPFWQNSPVADEVQRQYILGFLSESAYPLDDAPRVHPIAQDGDTLRRPPAQASIRQ
jgi:hypothetical protein